MDELFKDKGIQLYMDIIDDIKNLCLKISENKEWHSKMKLNTFGPHIIEKPYFIFYECQCVYIVNKLGIHCAHPDNIDRGKCGIYGMVLNEKEFEILEKCKNHMDFEWGDIIYLKK